MLYLGLRRRATPLIVSLFVAGAVTIIVSWLVPAVGHLPNAPHVPALLALRAGQLLNGVPQGLISFPSYHTTVAILLTAALVRERFLFPLACVLNGVMVISTLSMGGHYLVNVLAGIVIAVAALWLTLRLQSRALENPMARQPAWLATRTEIAPTASVSARARELAGGCRPAYGAAMGTYRLCPRVTHHHIHHVAAPAATRKSVSRAVRAMSISGSWSAKKRSWGTHAIATRSLPSG